MRQNGSMVHRRAQGGTLRARWRVRRRVRRAAPRRARLHDRLSTKLDALYPAPARGGVGDARAAARRRSAAPDVPARGGRDRTCHHTRHRRTGRFRRDARGAGGDLVRAIGRGSRRRDTDLSRSRGSSSTAAASRISPTRSPCETTCCSGSTRRQREDQPVRARVRLRRRGLRRRRGARRAPRSRAVRVAVLPVARAHTAALGARRRRADDPPGYPEPTWRVRVAKPEGAGDRNPCRRDAGVLSTERPRFSPGEPGFRHRRSCGRPESRRPLFLGSFGLPLDDRGRVRVDGTLRVAGREDIWALGDCAAVPDAEAPGRTDPPTCQHALRQARCLARNLTGTPEPYGYRMLGQVATLGRFKGIADVLGVHLSGFPGWFVARSYHLYALPLLSRRLRVVTDWTTALFFPRDIAELSSLGHPEGFEE